MSSCLGGGAGRTYAIDLELIKSPSSNFTRSSHNTPSPSSTISESSDSPLAISTRKPRTPRKRPKQTYNEAAALLSTVYPNIFSTKHLKHPSKFPKLPLHDNSSFFDESSSELLLPFPVIGNDNSCFLLHQPIQEKPTFQFEPKVTNLQYKPCCSAGEVDFQGNSTGLSTEFHEDFDAESILDEEIINEGIDSIMGNVNVDESVHGGQIDYNYWYGNRSGIGNSSGIGYGCKLDSGYGFRRGISALRGVDEGNWWCYPTVDILQISPKLSNTTSNGIGNSKSNETVNSNGNKNSSNGKKKVSSDKKKKKVEKGKGKSGTDVASGEPGDQNNKVLLESSQKENSSSSLKQSSPPTAALLLKLKYDDVLSSWSGRGSPFLDESLSSDNQGNDVSARLAQIDLFSESGVREASVMRYKEKRRTRLFSKKIRYQVRKVNADRRPRMKGRFVRRSSSSSNGQEEKGKKKMLLSEL